jgi:hypothetical protein
MKDYSQALIYLLYDITGEYEMVYVGSTALTLEKRLEIHIRSLQSFQKGAKGYGHIRAYDVMTKSTKWQAKILERYPCEDERELHLREAYWIVNTPKVVNRHVPLHTPEGKKQAHRQAVQKYDANHREEKRARQNQKFGCHCGKGYTMANRRKHWRGDRHQKFIDALKKMSRAEL